MESREIKWQRSTFCSDNLCIEVARIGDWIAMRDSKSPEDGFLRVDPDAWLDFITGINTGSFDLL